MIDERILVVGAYITDGSEVLEVLEYKQIGKFPDSQVSLTAENVRTDDCSPCQGKGWIKHDGSTRYVRCSNCDGVGLTHQIMTIPAADIKKYRYVCESKPCQTSLSLAVV